MYTQCPHCQAFFEVSAEHLKAAAGDVRCGQCLAVFNALDNLSETTPPQPAPGDGGSHPTEKPASDAPLFDDIPEPAAEQVAEQAPEAEPADAAPEDYRLGDLDEVTAPLETPLDNYDAAVDAVLDAGPLIPDETEGEPTPEAAIVISEDDLRQHLVESAPEPPSDTSTEPEPPASLPDREAEELAAFFADAHQAGDQPPPTEPPGAVADQPAPTETPETTQVPAVILQQLQAEKEARLRPSSTPWVAGSLLLMLLLVAQVIYFERNQLVRDPQYRDWIVRACEIAGCTLAVPYDIEQIDIISRDVRSHPSTKGGLIAATTLINNAPFPQPFPLLTLTFSDINGKRLAQRRFTPDEYLGADTDPGTGMPPDIPVPVELELVDPGKAAVNFEFRAEPDPRAARWRQDSG